MKSLKRTLALLLTFAMLMTMTSFPAFAEEDISAPAEPSAPVEVKHEEPKAEAPKAEAPKAEEKKEEAPKAEEKKAEAPKAEEKKEEAPKAEKKEEAPKAESKPAESKSEEQKSEEKKSEESKPAETKSEEKKSEESKPAETKTEEKKSEEKKSEESKPAEDKKSEEPKSETKTEDKKSEEPKAEETKSEEKKDEAPKAEDQKAEETKPEETQDGEAKSEEKQDEAEAPEETEGKAGQSEEQQEEAAPEEKANEEAEIVVEEEETLEEQAVEAAAMGGAEGSTPVERTEVTYSADINFVNTTEWTYDGREHDTVSSITVTETTKVFVDDVKQSENTRDLSNSEYTVKYYNGASIKSSEIKLKDAKDEAYNLAVVVEVGEDTFRKDQSFKVNVAKPAAPKLVAKKNLVYDGTEQELAEVQDVVAVGDITPTITYTNGKGKDATDYVVSATVDYKDPGNIENPTIENTVTATIAKAEPDAPTFTAVPGLVYDGTEQTLVEASNIVSVGRIAPTITYVNGTGVNAGDYEVTPTVDYNDANIANPTGIKTVAAKIAKAQGVAPTVDVSDRTFDGSNQLDKLFTVGEATAVAGVTPTVTKTYYLNGASVDAAVDVGTYIVNVTVNYGSDNIENPSVAPMSAQIKKAEPVVTLVAPEQELVYTGDEQTLATINGADTIGGITPEVVITNEKGTDANTYTVSATVNYKSGNIVDPKVANISVEIKKATGVAAELVPAEAKDLVFDNTEKTLATVKEGSLVEVAGVTPTYTITGDKQTAVGTYEVTLTTTYNNDNIFDPAEPVTATVEITAAPAPAAPVIERATNLVYDGNAQTLATITIPDSAVVLGVPPTLKVKVDGTEVTEIKGTDAKTYQIEAWYEYGNNISQSVTTTASVEIAQAEPAVPDVVPVEGITYDGSGKKDALLTIPEGTEIAGKKPTPVVTFAVDGEPVENPTDYGTYAATVEFKYDNANIANPVWTGEAAIGQAAPDEPVITPIENLIYSGEAQKLATVSDGVAYGDVTPTLVLTLDGQPVENLDALTGIDAADYTITAKYVYNNSNVQDTAEATETATIAAQDATLEMILVENTEGVNAYTYNQDNVHAAKSFVQSVVLTGSNGNPVEAFNEEDCKTTAEFVGDAPTHVLGTNGYSIKVSIPVDSDLAKNYSIIGKNSGDPNSDTVTFDLKAQPATLTLTLLDPEENADLYYYNLKDRNPKEFINNLTLVGDIDGTVEAFNDTTYDLSFEQGEARDAGAYTLLANMKADNQVAKDYAIIGATSQAVNSDKAEMTINKLPVTVTVKASQEKKYSEEDNEEDIKANYSLAVAEGVQITTLTTDIDKELTASFYREVGEQVGDYGFIYTYNDKDGTGTLTSGGNLETKEEAEITNYKVSLVRGENKYTIKSADAPEAPDITPIVGLIYNTMAQQLVNIPAGPTIGDSAATLKLTLNGEDVETVEGLVGTDAGEYTITAQYVYDDNVNDSAVATAKVTIAPQAATLEMTLAENTEGVNVYTYNQKNEHTAISFVDSVVLTGSDGKEVEAFNKTDCKATAEFVGDKPSHVLGTNGYSVKVSIPGDSDLAKNYSITGKNSGESNSDQLAFDLKAQPAKLTVTLLDPEKNADLYYYNLNVRQPKDFIDNITLVGDIDKTVEAFKETTYDLSFESGEARDAGTYTLVVKMKEDNQIVKDYAIVGKDANDKNSDKAEMTINKLPVTVTVKASQEKKYSEEDNEEDIKANYSLAVAEGVQITTLTTDINKELTASFYREVGEQVGDYGFIYTYNDKDGTGTLTSGGNLETKEEAEITNYKVSLVRGENKYTIKSADAPEAPDITPIVGLIYNTMAQQLVNIPAGPTIGDSVATLKLTLNGEDVETVDSLVGTDAGEYTITAQYVYDDNVNDSAITTAKATIAPQAATLEMTLIENTDGENFYTYNQDNAHEAINFVGSVAMTGSDGEPVAAFDETVCKATAEFVGEAPSHVLGTKGYSVMVSIPEDSDLAKNYTIIGKNTGASNSDALTFDLKPQDAVLTLKLEENTEGKNVYTYNQDNDHTASKFVSSVSLEGTKDKTVKAFDADACKEAAKFVDDRKPEHVLDTEGYGVIVTVDADSQLAKDYAIKGANSKAANNDQLAFNLKPQAAELTVTLVKPENNANLYYYNLEVRQPVDFIDTLTLMTLDDTPTAVRAFDNTTYDLRFEQGQARDAGKYVLLVTMKADNQIVKDYAIVGATSKDSNFDKAEMTIKKLPVTVTVTAFQEKNFGDEDQTTAIRGNYSISVNDPVDIGENANGIDAELTNDFAREPGQQVGEYGYIYTYNDKETTGKLESGGQLVEKANAETTNYEITLKRNNCKFTINPVLTKAPVIKGNSNTAKEVKITLDLTVKDAVPQAVFVTEKGNVVAGIEWNTDWNKTVPFADNEAVQSVAGEFAYSGFGQVWSAGLIANALLKVDIQAPNRDGGYETLDTVHELVVADDVTGVKLQDTGDASNTKYEVDGGIVLGEGNYVEVVAQNAAYPELMALDIDGTTEYVLTGSNGIYRLTPEQMSRVKHAKAFTGKDGMSIITGAHVVCGTAVSGYYGIDNGAEGGTATFANRDTEVHVTFNEMVRSVTSVTVGGADVGKDGFASGGKDFVTTFDSWKSGPDLPKSGSPITVKFVDMAGNEGTANGSVTQSPGSPSTSLRLTGNTGALLTGLDDSLQLGVSGIQYEPVILTVGSKSYDLTIPGSGGWTGSLGNTVETIDLASVQLPVGQPTDIRLSYGDLAGGGSSLTITYDPQTMPVNITSPMVEGVEHVVGFAEAPTEDNKMDVSVAVTSGGSTKEYMLTASGDNDAFVYFDMKPSGARYFDLLLDSPLEVGDTVTVSYNDKYNASKHTYTITRQIGNTKAEPMGTVVTTDRTAWTAQAETGEQVGQQYFVLPVNLKSLRKEPMSVPMLAYAGYKVGDLTVKVEGSKLKLEADLENGKNGVESFTKPVGTLFAEMPNAEALGGAQDLADSISITGLGDTAYLYVKCNVRLQLDALKTDVVSKGFYNFVSLTDQSDYWSDAIDMGLVSEAQMKAFVSMNR